MKPLKRVLHVLLLLVLLLFGCGENALLPDLQAVEEAGVLKIGVIENPPYSYQENGSLQGFDCALAEAVARELGVRAELVPLGWDQKWLALNEGTVDCVWGGISATDDLAETLGLSQSYLTGKPVLVVPLSSQKQTDFTGARIAAEEGSACALAGEICLGEIVLVPSRGQRDALDQVLVGNAAGAVVDAALAVSTEGLLIREDLALGTLEYKAVFRLHSDLIPAVDKALTALQDRGELARLAEQYGLDRQLVVG